MTTPRVKDNDHEEVTVTLGDKLLRSYTYENEAERRIKIGKAREFVEGWFQGSEHHAKHLGILADAMAEVKATSDGLSDQPITDIVQGSIDEIAALQTSE